MILLEHLPYKIAQASHMKNTPEIPSLHVETN